MVEVVRTECELSTIEFVNVIREVVDAELAPDQWKMLMSSANARRSIERRISRNIVKERLLYGSVHGISNTAANRQRRQ